MTIRGNYLDDWFVWDTTGDSPIHLDGIILYNAVHSPASRVDNIRIYNNHWGRNTGVRSTAAMISLFQSNFAQHTNVYIFNNVFESQAISNYGAGMTGWGNGDIAFGAVNLWIFNNTIIHDVGSSGKIGIATLENAAGRIYNNIIHTGQGVGLAGATATPNSGANTGANTQLILDTYFDNLWSDYNIFRRNPPNNLPFECTLYQNPFLTGWWIGGSLYNLDGWQTWFNNNRGMSVPIWNTTHADPHSVDVTATGIPISFVSGTFVPSSTDTVARGKGLNLSAVYTEMNAIFGDNLTPADYNGVARPATGNWTIGAFEAGGTVDSPPTINTRTIPAAGTSISLVFSENVTVNNFSGFTISRSGAPITLSAGTVVNPTTISYTLSRAANPGETIRLSYEPVANGIEDSAGQDLASFLFISHEFIHDRTGRHSCVLSVAWRLFLHAKREHEHNAIPSWRR